MRKNAKKQNRNLQFSSSPEKSPSKPKNPSPPKNPKTLSLFYNFKIKSGNFQNKSYINIKYQLILQDQWKLTTGEKTGITLCGSSGNSKNAKTHFNFSSSFKISSKNLFNSPQIIFLVFAADFFGRSKIIGYGSVFLPFVQGRVFKRIRLFGLESHSWLSGFIGDVMGQGCEFVDFKESLVMGEGREFCRARGLGFLDVEFEVLRSGWRENGFD